jgi:hypothetical protein
LCVLFFGGVEKLALRKIISSNSLVKPACVATLIVQKQKYQARKKHLCRAVSD